MPQAHGGPHHRCEGYIATVQIKSLVVSLFRYTSAEQGHRRPTLIFCAAGKGGVSTVENCVGAAA